jgi:hypothetical protein
MTEEALMSNPRRLPTWLASAAVATIAATALVATVPAAEARPSSITTSYACSTPFGPQTVSGTTSVNLPAKVRRGDKVADRRVQVQVVLPAAVVAAARDFLGVTAISGKATNAFYRVGAKKIALTRLVLPRTALPARGPLTLKATGVAKGFRLTSPGTYAVKVPLSFRLHAADQHGQPIPGTPLVCSLASGAPSKLGTIKVG